MKSWRMMILSTILVLGVAVPSGLGAQAASGLPGQPANVHVYGVSQAAVLTWTAPSSSSPIAEYQVLEEMLQDGVWYAVLSPVRLQTPTLATVSGLQNGPTYRFSVRARNAAGWGPESTHLKVIPSAALPANPTNISVTAGDSSATVSWASPAGVTVDHYLLIVDRQSIGMVSYLDDIHGTSATITGLSNGTPYLIEVRTVDTHSMLSSGALAQVTPQAGGPVVPPAPGAPTGVTAVAGDHSASVTWTSPVILTIYRLSAYQINVYQGGQLVSPWHLVVPATSTSWTVQGLTNGLPYTFTVQAQQSSLVSPYQTSTWSNESAASNAVIPASIALPAAPANVDTHGSSTAAIVTWSAPSSPSPITAYQVITYQAVGSQWQAVTASVSYQLPTLATVGQLVNGQTYRFTVRAANATGWGPESAPSRTIVPGIWAPASPVLVSATSGNGSATVSWAAPAGVSVSHYLLRVYQAGGGLVQYRDGITSTSAVISGLTNGVTYRIDVHTIDATGMMSGAASATVTPTAAARIPDPVTDVRAVAGNGMATVSWLPAFNGGSPITSYTVAYSANPNDVAAIIHLATDGSMFSGGRWSTPVYGLTNGKTYTFYVYASNALGISQLAVSNSVVPSAPARAPDAVSDIRAVAGNGQATVRWLPAFDGGSPITSYAISTWADPHDSSSVKAIIHPATDGGMFSGGRWSTTISGLTNGTTYTFYVFAINAVGISPAAVSNRITPGSVPGAVRNLVVTPGDGSLVVKWDAPSDNGGFPITSYQVTASDGVHAPVVATVSKTSATLSGLTNGTTYTVTVRATNSIGSGSQASVVATTWNLAPTLSVPAGLTVDYGDAVHATITAKGPEASDHLVLSASGLPHGVTFTDQGNGTGLLAGAAQVPAGLYPLTFTANDGHNAPVSQSMTLTVTREQAAVRLYPTAPLSVVLKKATQTKAASLTIRATIHEVTDPNGYGDIGEAANVSYTLTSLQTGATYSGKAATTGQGIEATLTVKYTFHNIPRGIYELRISVGGSYYQGTAEAMVAVSGPGVHGGVTGNGQVEVPGNNASAHFQLQAQRLANGKLSGSLLYVEDHAGTVYTFQSTSITALVFKGHIAYIQGMGTLNGVGHQQFVATIVDNHRQGGVDRFGLRVIDASFATVSHCTFGPVDLTSGQARIVSA